MVTKTLPPTDAPPLPTVVLGGLRLHAITETQCIEHILHELAAGRGGWVVTPNLDILRQAHRDPDVRTLVEQASLRVPDGMPLVWASRLQRTPVPERVAGSSLIGSLSAAAARAGRSVFLLGGAPGAAVRAARVLQAQCAGLRVAGTWCPPLGFENDPAELPRMVAHLRRTRPDLVFVGLGAPKQERLIARLRPELPQAWWLGVGISFSYLCGLVRPAPRWMQRAGLEWCYRLLQEPRRLGRRYLLLGVPFALALLAVAAARRWRPAALAERANPA